MLLVAAPILGADETAALAEVIDSGWITMGPRVRAFEEAFARTHGVADCVAVSSCTAGLHLILHALGLGPGDEVLVPSLTFVATANSVVYVGAKPVFLDIESVERPHLSLEDAEAKRTERTRAVILMHYAGYLCDRDAWRGFARRYGLLLIEDTAHALAVENVGTYGDAAAFSFYGNKNMTTAEGGMVFAKDPVVLERIRQLRGHGLTTGTFQRLSSGSSYYDVPMLGFNYRMDELRAAIGLSQLGRLQGWNTKRKALTATYRTALRTHCPDAVAPFDAQHASANHIMPVLLPARVDRSDVVAHLRDAEVQTTMHYPPVHTLTYYQRQAPDLRLPETEEFARRELTLPLHPAMTDDDVEHVVRSLSRSLNRRGGT
jgi:dTDP-4-amino-4,6-dideoxygalactose transaminase